MRMRASCARSARHWAPDHGSARRRLSQGAPRTGSSLQRNIVITCAPRVMVRGVLVAAALKSSLASSCASAALRKASRACSRPSTSGVTANAAASSARSTSSNVGGSPTSAPPAGDAPPRLLAELNQSEPSRGLALLSASPATAWLALRWPSRQVALDPVAGRDLDRPVVTGQRSAYCHFGPRHAGMSNSPVVPLDVGGLGHL